MDVSSTTVLFLFCIFCNELLRMSIAWFNFTALQWTIVVSAKFPFICLHRSNGFQHRWRWPFHSTGLHFVYWERHRLRELIYCLVRYYCCGLRVSMWPTTLCRGVSCDKITGSLSFHAPSCPPAQFVHLQLTVFLRVYMGNCITRIMACIGNSVRTWTPAAHKKTCSV